MPEDSKPTEKSKPEPHEKVIRIVINAQNQGEKSEVIIAQGASNHYTDHGFNSDTCCTCDT